MAVIDLAAPGGDNLFDRIKGADEGPASAQATARFDDCGVFVRDTAMSARVSDADAPLQRIDPRPAADFPAVFDLATLDGINGVRLFGINVADYSGSSVSNAGDVNGDGFDDIIIGARGGDPGGDSSAGESYVVFGRADGIPASFDLAVLGGANGFRIDGVDAFDQSGVSVSSAGDVNGDGFDDIIIGAPGGGPIGDGYVGKSYVVFGKAGGFTTNLDLAALDGNNGFLIEGIDLNDRTGYSVSDAGDVNGDGFDDIIIGGSYADAGGNKDAGESYVVFGKAGGFAASLDLAMLDGSNGFRLDGVDASDFSGRSVSSADDVNGDGFDDIVIGAPFAASGAGESYVIFGRAPTEAVRREGSVADQEIRGGAFDDTLSGRGGDDTLAGGGGSDRLKGGGGADSFALDDDLAEGDRALVKDFTSGTDLFQIDADDFGGGLQPSALDPDAFVVNTTGQAGDADDRFIYDSGSGRLFYDADGSGLGEGVLIARLKDAPTIEASDFIVV